MKRIIHLLVLLTIFVSSYRFFVTPFEGYFFYLPFLVLGPIFFFHYRTLPKKLMWLFLVLLGVGVYQIVQGNNTPRLFIKIYFGVSLSAIFYFYYLKYTDFDVFQVFRWYLKGAVIVALIGLFQWISFLIGFEPGYNFGWILNKWGVSPAGLFIRINSILSEPSHFARALAPAAFVALYQLFIRKQSWLKWWQCGVILFTYLFTISTVAYFGVFLSFILIVLNMVRFRTVLIVAAVLSMSIYWLYSNDERFQLRIDDTYALFTTGQEMIEKGIFPVNTSSFVLYNHFHIATENFSRHPLTGTGLGSHPIAFDRYSLTKLNTTPGTEFNALDANSLLLRLMSETGLLGLVFFGVLVWRYYIRRRSYLPHYDERYWVVSNAILVMFALYAVRTGHYFINGFPLFIWLYYFNYKNYKQLSTSNSAV